MHANLFRTWLYLAAIVATVQAAGGLARGEDPVAVLVTGPLAGTIGERVSFEVEIVNRSGQPLQKLRIVDYFDSGFHHEASKSPIEQTGTIDLAAGTSRRLTLDFILDEPGRQCHRVEIIDQSQKFVGGATACVQVAAAPTATPVPQAPPIIAPPATPIAPPTGSAFTQPTTNTAADHLRSTHSNGTSGHCICHAFARVGTLWTKRTHFRWYG